MNNLSEYIIAEGVPVCNGICEGKAMVITSSIDFPKILNNPEEVILVVHNFDPNYDILLDRCLGIISELGNMLCHLAIVSRIRKIPSLVQTTDVTTLIADGDEVTIDAYNGVLYRGLYNKEISQNNLALFHEFSTKIKEE